MFVARCNYCGDDAHSPYTCSYCGRKHCPEHRLPEKHACLNLHDARPPSSRPRRAREQSNTSIRSKLRAVTPGTVGTSESPSYPSSPPVGLKDGSGASEDGSSNLSTRLQVIVLTPFHVLDRFVRSVPSLGSWVVGHARAIALVLLVATSLVATGTVSTADYIGPAGEPVDEVGRAVGAFVGVVVSDLSGALDASGNSSSRDATTNPASGGGGGDDARSTESGLDTARTERLVHLGINVVRNDDGLVELNHDARLREIAREHSEAMADAGYIYHTGPDGDLGDRLARAGYECRVEVTSTRYVTGGENVAKTWYRQQIVGGIYHDSPGDVASGLVDQWMTSQGHRENILRPYWRNEGIGIVVVEEDGKMAVYATQVFC